MKLKLVFSIFILEFLCFGIANSQIIINNQKLIITENNKQLLSRHVNEFTAFTINKKELVNNLYSNGGKGQFQLKIDNELDLDIWFGI